MPNWLIALFFSAGASGWIYVKLVRSNGDPTPGRDLIAATIAGVFIFLVLWSFMELILDF